MIALLLALGSSLAYGCADFLGGLGARKAHVLRTVMIAAPASLTVELLLWPLLGASLAWGAASGVASAAAFALLYRTLAIGPMNVLSPITALVSAMLPVGVGLGQGEHLGPAGLIGLPLALAAVVLVSGGHGAGSTRPSRTALLSAFGAGTAIALQLVFLHQAPADSGVGPLIVGRAVSSAVTLAAAGLMSRRLGAEKPAYAMSAAAGVLDSLANLLFLLAARNGDLTVVAVITALYPAGTVLLARSVLAERIHRGQLIGLGTAAIAVSLLTDGHDFGLLSVNGLLGHAPIVVPTHFTAGASTLLIHLARANPVWKTIEADPNVTFTVTGDYAVIPGPWRAKPGTPRTEGVPTSYYTAVQFTCRATIIDSPEGKAELLRRQMAHFQPEGDHALIEVGRPPYGRMLPGIRGLRLHVAEVRAKFKYDDHKPVEQRSDTARRLTDRGQGLDAPTADQQLRRLDRIGPWKS